MELLTLVVVWPLLVLALGIVFVAGSDVSGSFLIFPMVLLLFLFMFGLSANMGGLPKGKGDESDELDRARRGAIAFSIALLLPVFVKYLLDMTQDNLGAMIGGLVLGFGVLVWGMFQKGNRVLSYANVMGGIFVIVYLYIHLWDLGQLAQVIATASGLVMAIVISIVKFREKLT